MKRAGNIWDKVVDLENIRHAYELARKGRTKRSGVIAFEKDLDSNLGMVRKVLMDDEYKTSQYNFFDKIEGGKLRHIASLPFFDRVVQWAVILQTRDVFINSYICQTYAAIPGRGTHYALRTLKKYLRGSRSEYCLKMDVYHYFESIDKDKMFLFLKRRFKDPHVLIFFKEVIYGYPRPGMPVGNLTSQYLANLYLAYVDRYFKQTMHVVCYQRYMDDIVMIGKTKSWLRRMKNKMVACLEEIGLKLNRHWQIFPCDVRGVDFVGYRSFSEYTLLRRRTKIKIKHRMKDILCKLIINDYIPTLRDRGQYASDMGILSHCNAYRLSRVTILPVKDGLEARNGSCGSNL